MMRVFEKRVLRRTFGPKRDEVTREWRKLHNEERNDLYSSPNNFRLIKLKRMSWAGHVVRVGERRGGYRVLVGKSEGKRHLEDRGLDVKIILRWIFRNWDGGMDGIELTLDRGRWRTLMNAVMNLQVP